MRLSRSHLAAALCATWLIAGCGSSTKTVIESRPATAQTSSTPTTPSSSLASLAHGGLGTLGPPPAGRKYTAQSHAFLERLAAVVGHFLESQGLHNVSVTCTASVPQQATCRAAGTNSQGTTSSGKFRIDIDRTTGELTFAPG